MARSATIKRATAREAVKNSMRDGALSRLRTDPEKNYTTVIVGVLCALVAGYGTYRFLNDDYELSFERNLRHMSQNVVACVQTKRVVNTNGPIPVCFDPVSGQAVTVDVATLPPAAVPPAVSKDAAKDAPKKASDAKPVSVQTKPVVSPLIFHHPSRKLFNVPGHDAPMTLFKPR